MTLNLGFLKSGLGLKMGQGLSLVALHMTVLTTVTCFHQFWPQCEKLNV